MVPDQCATLTHEVSLRHERVRVLPNKPVRLFSSIKPKRAGGHAPPRVVTSYLCRRSARRRAASLADMGRTSTSRGRVQLVTSVTWLK